VTSLFYEKRPTGYVTVRAASGLLQTVGLAVCSRYPDILYQKMNTNLFRVARIGRIRYSQELGFLRNCLLRMCAIGVLEERIDDFSVQKFSLLFDVVIQKNPKLQKENQILCRGSRDCLIRGAVQALTGLIPRKISYCKTRGVYDRTVFVRVLRIEMIDPRRPLFENVDPWATSPAIG
jgi:hypothetical protein